jgi:predicted  nucleic acid-binding Zn-ribbon protein
MTKILLIAAIIFSLGAGVLGFLNRGSLIDTRTDLQNTESQLASVRQELGAAQQDIEGQKKDITDLSSEKDTLTANLGEAESQLNSIKNELAAAQEQAEAIQNELSLAQADGEAKDTRIAELEQIMAEGGPVGTPEAVDLADITAERDELRTVVAGLEDRAAGLQAQIAELSRKEQARQQSQMRQGLQGTILAVNQSWNFVVLSLGDRQGVVPNAEMIVQRGSQMIGRVRVTSVEPSTSIADILLRTVPRGFTVMPGDTVIYQAQRD